MSHEVPKGSLLRPCLFLIYVNDFAESISNGELHLYVDDTTGFVIGNSMDQVVQLLNLLLKAGLSLRFQVAGYLLLVAGEVASSHGAPPPPPLRRRF